MKYIHDCENCIPLGEYGDSDLYYCDQAGGASATVIARFGDDGPNYTSGLALVHLDERLAEAYRRAKEQGLIEVAQ